MTADALFPLFRPVADRALLVEFGAVFSTAANDRVGQLDRALAASPFAGFTEAVPAYVNLLVGFDPALTDHARVEAALRALIAAPEAPATQGVRREVSVCYDPEFGPDLAGLADSTGLSVEAVVAAHLAGDYRVVMYGFAPGFAYLTGVPAAIQRPRKPVPVRGVAAGSVVVAASQCLVSTLVMPTGWHIIGRSPTRILREGEERPFLFDVGDGVAFRRIDRAAFDREAKAG